MKKWLFPGFLALIVAAMLAIFALGNKGDSDTPAPEENRFGTKHEEEGNAHVDPGSSVSYKTNPPSSGSHYPEPAPWGIKDSELPDEVLVHNMEHGGVVIFYKPDLPSDQIEQLKQIFNNLPKSQSFNTIKAVLVPRTKNDRPISLGAWTYTLSLDNVDEGQIRQFYESHVDKGPELVP